MRHVRAISCVLAATLALAGCGAGGNTQTNTEPATTESKAEPAPTQPEAKAEEKAQTEESSSQAAEEAAKAERMKTHDEFKARLDAIPKYAALDESSNNYSEMAGSSLDHYNAQADLMADVLSYLEQNLSADEWAALRADQDSWETLLANEMDAGEAEGGGGKLGASMRYGYGARFAAERNQALIDVVAAGHYAASNNAEETTTESAENAALEQAARDRGLTVISGTVRVHFEDWGQAGSVVSMTLDTPLDYSYDYKGATSCETATEVRLAIDDEAWAQYQGRHITVACSSLYGAIHAASMQGVDALAQDPEFLHE